MKTNYPINETEKYIKNCPKEVQNKLREIRSLIREVAPDSTKRTDHFQFPGYSYEGFDYNGMFVWFSYKKPFVCLHVRPPVIDDHKNELVSYTKTKAIVKFPVDKEIPAPLVKKLIKARMNINSKKIK